MWERSFTAGRRRKELQFVLCLVGALALVTTVVLVSSAQARKTHPYLLSFTAGAGSDVPEGIALNQTTGEVYVVGALKGVVYRFKEGGQPNLAHPTLTGMPAGFNPHYVAVDNSGAPTNGLTYVSGAGGIQQFASSGAATAVEILGAALPPNGTSQGGGLAPVSNNGSFEPRAVAIGPTGAVFTVDQANQAIDKFSSTGDFVAQYAAGEVGINRGLAITTAEEFYLANAEGLIKRDSTGECVNSCVPIDAGESGGVAVDATGDVLITSGPQGASVVKEFSASGTLLSESADAHLVFGGGVAVGNVSGRVFVVNLGQSAGPPAVGFGVAVFGATVVIPDATTEAATGVTSSGATLNGQVSAAEGSAATCQFEYVTAAQFSAGGFEGAETAPCEPAGPFTGGGITHVEHTINLVGGTTYHYRLTATNSLGSTNGADELLTTHGPSVLSEAASAISETSATLEASIDPRGSQTAYQFQYVDQAQFDESGFASATAVPMSSVGIGSGTAGVAVSQAIDNLIPGTRYHFRVLASNAEGPTISAGGSFRTYAASTGLPDDRRYEQVSPTEKGGAGIQMETNAIQAAADGSGVTFFLNAGLAGGEGSGSFPSYLSSRSADGAGWSTQGLLPPAATGPIGRVAGWTEDLNTSFLTNQSGGGAPTLYLRDNTDRSLTQIVTGGVGTGRTFSVADSNGPWVLFEAQSGALAAGAAAGKTNSYLWNRDTGKLILAGILNNKKAPALGSFTGPYDWYVSESTTEGGSGGTQLPVTALYYTRAEHVLAPGASRLFFTAAGTGQIFMRVNPTAAQSTLDSHGSCKEPEKACTVEISEPDEGVVDPEGEKPAAFIGATPDGSTAFFLSAENLTPNANTGPGSAKDLYRYEVASGILTDLTSDEADEGGADVQGVIGTSEDGSYVYFVANGVLAPGATPGSCRIGQPVGSCNLYLLHGSTVTFVARVEPGGQNRGGGSDLSNWAPTSEIRGGGVTTQENVGRVTPDGRTLLFRSSGSPTAYQSGGFTELYRYHVGDPGPICISCNPTGAVATGNAALQNLEIPFTGPRLQFSTMTRNLSSDGDRVFFETPERLVSTDTNGVADVYEWEAPNPGGEHDSCKSTEQNGGCLFLISSGTNPQPSRFGDASVSGDDVFFLTAAPLVAQDRDELVDMYDARVGGGIAAQNKGVSSPCAGEACLSETAPPSASSSVGTTVERPGNPVAPIKCKPGFKRVVKKGKERCVKKPKAKQRRHKSGGKHAHTPKNRSHTKGRRGDEGGKR